jgi:hypothetical protein
VHEVKTVASDHRKNARGSHHTGAFIVPRPYSCGSIDLTPGEKENKNRKINVFFCSKVNIQDTPRKFSR